MAIAFTLLSLLGLLVFAGAGDIPVALIFLGLLFVYISDAVWKFGLVKTAKLISIRHSARIGGSNMWGREGPLAFLAVHALLSGIVRISRML
jgi:hypothetical protein